MDPFTEETEFGDVFEDIGNTVSDGFDMLGDAVKAIPGGQWVIDGAGSVTGVVGDFVKGPLRDFARTGIGETIMRAASIALGSAALVVPQVGFTLMFLTWSIPGLAKGESFDEAMVKEFIYRCQKVAEYFADKAGEEAGKAAGEALTKQLQTATEKLKSLADSSGIQLDQIADKLGLTPEKLAAMLDIREDAAAYALEWTRRKGEEAIKLINGKYDVASGNIIPSNFGKKLNKSFGKVKKNTMTAQEAYEQAVKLKLPPATIEALRKKAAATKTVKAAISPPVSAAVKSSLATTSKTLAAQTAVSQAAVPVADGANTQLVTAAASQSDSRSTKLGIAAGLVGAGLGVGGSLVAGLSATVAAPVGIGFGIGSGLVTKLLTRRK